MDELLYLVNKYIVKHNNQLKKICQPLWDYFGINYFMYQKISKNNEFLALGNSPEFPEYYRSSEKEL